MLKFFRKKNQKKKSEVKVLRKLSNYSIFRDVFKSYLAETGYRVCGKGQYFHVLGILWRREGVFEVNTDNYEGTIKSTIFVYFSLDRNNCLIDKSKLDDNLSKIHTFLMSEQHTSFDWWVSKTDHFSKIFPFLDDLVKDEYKIEITDSSGTVVILMNDSDFEALYADFIEANNEDLMNGSHDNYPNFSYEGVDLEDGFYVVKYSLGAWSLTNGVGDEVPAGTEAGNRKERKEKERVGSDTVIKEEKPDKKDNVVSENVLIEQEKTKQITEKKELIKELNATLDKLRKDYDDDLIDKETYKKLSKSIYGKIESLQ